MRKQIDDYAELFSHTFEVKVRQLDDTTFKLDLHDKESGKRECSHTVVFPEDMPFDPPAIIIVPVYGRITRIAHISSRMEWSPIADLRTVYLSDE